MPSAPEPTTLTFAPTFCIWYIFTVLTIYLLIQLYQAIRHKIKRSRQYKTHYPLTDTEPVTTRVYLKLWTGLRQAVIQIDTLCAPHHHLTVTLHKTAQSFLKVTAKYTIFRMKLHLAWQNLFIKHLENDMHIPLPAQTKLPKQIHYLVHAILRDHAYHPVKIRHRSSAPSFPVHTDTHLPP